MRLTQRHTHRIHAVPATVGHHVGHAVPGHTIVEATLVGKAKPHLTLHTVQRRVVAHHAICSIRIFLLVGHSVCSSRFGAFGRVLGGGATASLSLVLKRGVVLVWSVKAKGEVESIMSLARVATMFCNSLKPDGLSFACFLLLFIVQ